MVITGKEEEGGQKNGGCRMWKMILKGCMSEPGES